MFTGARMWNASGVDLAVASAWQKPAAPEGGGRGRVRPLVAE
jgi:hypothetical protein